MFKKRIVKDSAHGYKNVMDTNGAILSVNNKNAQGEILFMTPVFKQMIWGGNKLAKEWGYEIPSDNTGECWAISAHPNGDCTVNGGRYGGKRLSELWETAPELFGNVDSDRFPLLVKIIDAKSDLSIQVHPNDEYASKHENGSLGKMECWYILDAPEGAELVIGHNAKDRAELENMIKNGRWTDFLRHVPVKKGDFIQINPGTVHAIKGGIEILETQQNSDITYRVYDYDRLSDGKPRQLHINQSIDVITVPAKDIKNSVIRAEDINRKSGKNKLGMLISCDYYRVWQLVVSGTASFEQEYPFLIMSVTDGDGLINGQYIKKGDHFILPCGFGKVEISGDMMIIASSVNES